MLFFLPAARASTFIWTGLGADNNWATTLNWSPSSALTTADLIFSGTTPWMNPYNNTTGLNFNSISFDATAGSYTIGGNQIAMYLLGSGTILNQGTNAQAITANISLSNANHWDVMGQSGTGSGTLTLSGILSGVNSSIEKVGTGTLILGGANTFSSLAAYPTTVLAGTLQLGNNLALGNTANTVSLNGGTLALAGCSPTVYSIPTFQASATLNVGGGTLTVYTGATVNTTGFTAVWAGTITGTGIVSINNGNSEPLVSASPAITLTAANTFSGTLQQSNGLVVVGTALALQNATVNCCNVGSNAENCAAYLMFGTGVTTATFGGLQGANVNLASWNNIGYMEALNLVTSDTKAVTLMVGNNGANTTFWGTIASYTTVTNSNNLATITGYVSGTLVKVGSGTLTLAGSTTTRLDSNGYANFNGNFYSGGTQINQGTLNIDGDLELGVATCPLSFTGNATLQVSSSTASVSLNSQRTVTLGTGFTATFDTQSQALSIAGVIGGGGNLNKLGAGTLTLSVANTYGGLTSISAGTLLLANTLALQQSTFDCGSSGTAGLSFGTLAAATFGGLQGTNNFTLSNTASAAVALSVGNNGANTVYNGILGGGGSLTKIGGGTLTLTGANTYGGATTISAGTLQLGNGGAGGSIASGTVTDNATLAFNLSGTATYATAVGGTGNLTQLGPGTLVLTGSNTSSGVTTVSAGTLALANTLALQQSTFDCGSSGTAKLSFGTLAAATFGGLQGTNNFSLLNASSVAVAFSVGNNGANTTYNGILGGAGSLTKIGGGTLTLTGASTYGGATTISAGTLQIGNGGTSGSIASGTVTDNATLAFNRSGTATYATAVGGTGNLTQLGPGTLVLTGSSTYGGATTISAGTLQIGTGRPAAASPAPPSPTTPRWPSISPARQRMPPPSAARATSRKWGPARWCSPGLTLSAASPG